MSFIWNFFFSEPIPLTVTDILKEGYLEKESRNLKTWRKRWAVLTKHHFYTFKNEKDYSNPTEKIELSTILVVKSDDDIENCFKVCLNNKEVFFFKVENQPEKERWIKTIGAAWIKLLNKHQVNDDEDNKDDKDNANNDNSEEKDEPKYLI